MPSLTSNFLENRRKANRYRSLVLPVLAFLVVGAAVSAGIFLYKQNPAGKKTLAVNDKAAAHQTLPKDWVLKYFGTANENDPKVGGPGGDPDQDGLTNWQEFYFGTDPTKQSTMNDGMADGVKVAFNINPLNGGQLYATDYAKNISQQYLADNQLEELKPENIQKTVQDLLNPPDPAQVEIILPDPKTLNVVNNNSPEFIDAYLQKTDQVGADMQASQDVLMAQLDNPTGVDAATTISSINQTISDMQQMPVPRDFLKLHQLTIAGLFAASNILELNKQADPQQPLENQKTVLQEQYYQTAVIQKIQQEINAESLALNAKYPDVTNKYATIVNSQQSQ